MKSEKLREFYDLCQEYRHTPMDSIVAVAGAYERLVKFVDALVDEKLPDTTVSGVGGTSAGWGHSGACLDGCNCDLARAAKRVFEGDSRG